MKKRIAAIVLCVFCLLAIAGCSQSKPDAETAQPTAAQETGDYLTTISGTYEELFPQLAKAEYRDLWIDATTPLVGAENAETATDTLLAMCMAEPYGAEAAEKYAADPDSMAFNCYFLGGVAKFLMDGDTITVKMNEHVDYNGKTYPIAALPENLMDIIQAGGLVKAMRKRNGLD